MHANLMDQLIDHGARLIACLEADDFDTFRTLFDEREDLLDALRASGSPEAVSPTWMDQYPTLAAQERRLAELLGARAHRLSETLQGMRRYQDARRQYAAPPPRRRILNRHLQG